MCTPALLTPTPRVYHPYFTLYVIICKHICKKCPVIERSTVAVHTVNAFLQIAYKNLPFPWIFSPDSPFFRSFSAGFIRNFKISSPCGHRLYTQFAKNTPPCAPGRSTPRLPSHYKSRPGWGGFQLPDYRKIFILPSSESVPR